MTNQFPSIESVRDLFESALRSELSPQIDDYLPLVPTQQRGELQQLLMAVEALRKRPGADLQAARSDPLVAANDLPTSSSISPSPADGPLAETVVAGGSCCFLSADGNAISFVDQKLAEEIDHDFQPGTIIHERYLLVSVLGRGGMGCVLLARDQLLNRQVAMKVVAVRFERDQAAFQEALAREARLGASLNDAGIAAVYDFGIHAGKSFTIFEYVDGETLRQLLKRCRQLHLADVQRIICSMARSLDFAHSQGVIHRDLKPENICITKQGQPKILDFGIARDLRMDFQLEGFCGTPQYAAPEQAACSATDGRTDQYALGLLAWEMLAGRRVFEAANAHELLEMHRHTQPENLLSLCPDLSAKFGMAIHRTLQKDPAKRYATCQEFASELGGAFQESTVAGLRHASTRQELRAVYLCHVGDDSLIASSMASQLEAKGYTTWYYQRDAKTSSPFLRQAAQAIRNASAAVLLISPAALRSDEFADEISEASQYGRLLIPLLIGLTTEDFENHHPGWRPLLGAAMVTEAGSSPAAVDILPIIAALASVGVIADPQSKSVKSPASPDSSRPLDSLRSLRSQGIAGQTWATDASQINVLDLNRVVFRNPQVDSFLRHGNKYFLVGTKGQGKTLLLTYKRHLMSQAASKEHDRGLCFVPQGSPYLDFMSDLKSLSVRFEKPLSELATCKRFWSMALRVSAISNHRGVMTSDEDEELEIFPSNFRLWLRGKQIEPTIVFKELTDLSISQANALIDDSETFLDQKLRSIHSSTYFFIDKVDQAVGQLGREAWINIQAGLIEAAWDLMSVNSHVKVFASIRQEAFVNYHSDIKINLLGATTALRYSEDELQNLMDRLCGCYEASQGFKDFLGIRVIKHPRRPIPEDSFQFIRRHSFGRPRDLVVIAAELSCEKEGLSEAMYCKLVRRASASYLVPGIFEEMRVFLDCLGDQATRMRFLEILPTNIVDRRDAVTICARFNGISEEMVLELGDATAHIFHPFQDLYLAGLLGVIQTAPDSDRQIQMFRRPDDMVNCLGTDLPVSTYYLLHPALTSFVRELKRTSHFFSFEHVVVGDQLPWEPWDNVYCQIERCVAEVTDESLRQTVHLLLKRGREVLKSSSPRNLPLILQAMPEWQIAQTRLLSQGHDDVLLWLEELIVAVRG